MCHHCDRGRDHIRLYLGHSIVQSNHLRKHIQNNRFHQYIHHEYMANPHIRQCYFRNSCQSTLKKLSTHTSDFILNFENHNNSLKVINYQEVKMFDTYLVKMQLD